MTKLHTAAEARRIDIERGGEGRILNDNFDTGPFFYDQTNLCWRWERTEEEYFGPQNKDSEQWLPLTASLDAPSPEPEQLTDNDKARMALNELEQETIVTLKRDKEQLEKELAELKERARWKSCEKEVPSDSKILVFKENDKTLVYSNGIWNGEWQMFWPPMVLTDDQIKNWHWKYEADL
jgi:hypothetical protein